MGPKLQISKAVGHTKHYLAEGIPSRDRDHLREAVRDLGILLQTGGKAVVAFDLPTDVVPVLEGEEFVATGLPVSEPYRLTSLDRCGVFFSTIWEMTGAFGSGLVVCFFPGEIDTALAVNETRRYLEDAPLFTIQEAIAYNNAFVMGAKRSMLILTQFWDGLYLLVSSSLDLVELAQAILRLFEVDIDSKTGDFDWWPEMV